jgi:hypothetical protein
VFVAVAEDDVVVFEVLEPPAVTKFDELLARAPTKPVPPTPTTS